MQHIYSSWFPGACFFVSELFHTQLTLLQCLENLWKISQSKDITEATKGTLGSDLNRILEVGESMLFGPLYKTSGSPFGDQTGSLTTLNVGRLLGPWDAKVKEIIKMMMDSIMAPGR